MPPTDLHRKAELQFELRRRGIRQQDVAARCDVTEPSVSKVIAGTYPDATEEGRKTRDAVLGVIAEMIREHDEKLAPAAPAVA